LFKHLGMAARLKAIVHSLHHADEEPETAKASESSELTGRDSGGAEGEEEGSEDEEDDGDDDPAETVAGQVRVKFQHVSFLLKDLRCLNR